MSENKKELYCLVCKQRRVVDDARLEHSTFKTKSGKDMTRYCYKGTCSHCHKRVNHFAKKPQEGGTQ